MARTPKNSDENAGTSSGMATNPKIDHDLIRELAKLLDETGLTEIEYEQSGSRVRVVARQGFMLEVVKDSTADNAK